MRLPAANPAFGASRRQLLVAAAAAAGAAVPHPRSAATEPVAPLRPGVGAAVSRPVDLQGHRGARWHLAENTLEGFELALAMGVRTLELDVVVTRDDQLVISHDPALNPDITRDAQGQFLHSTGPDIRSLTWSQLQVFDVGRIKPGTRYAGAFSAQQGREGLRIPRLQDLFDRVRALGRNDVRFAIETKLTPHAPVQTPGPERFVELLMAQVRDAGLMQRVQVLSFDWRTLMVLRQHFPQVPRVCLSAQLPALNNLRRLDPQGSPWTAGLRFQDYGSVPRMVLAAGGTHWSSFWRELDADSVQEAQALGLQVLAWTVNEREAMHRMLDWGVNGIVTDRPDLGLQVLRERGLSLA
jgi:glycerophosphoryl diester phosphodiesterase